VTKFKISKKWRITRLESEFALSGGSDAIYTIDAPEGKSFFDTVGYDAFQRDKLSDEDQIIFEQLLSAEIVKPILKTAKKSIAVSEISDKKNYSLLSKSSNEYDLLVLIRTRTTFADFLERVEYLSINKPHLFVDLAYNHVISFGPLVFPGDTACIACLQGRITRRWGDNPPPPDPDAADRYKEVASSHLKQELMNLENGDYFLVNKTSSLDMANRTINNNKLLKVPVCPYCETYSKINNEFINSKISL